jgi:methylthioribulose-1-phosphate dehydratase
MPDDPLLSLTEAGAVLAAEAARFHAYGWMRGTSGNLSAVVSRDPLRLVVTASGVDKGELQPHDVVLVDEAGRADDGGSDGRRPSAEAALHARIARVTGAGAVVHVHTVSAVVAADRHPAGVVLRDLEMLKALGRADHDTVTIPVVTNSQDMAELGDRFEAARQAATPAFVVARHGLYCWGADHTQARHHTEAVCWLLDYVVARG